MHVYTRILPTRFVVFGISGVRQTQYAKVTLHLDIRGEVWRCDWLNLAVIASKRYITMLLKYIPGTRIQYYSCHMLHQLPLTMYVHLYKHLNHFIA